MRLLSVVEALDNGKPIRETRDADVPTVVRHFYHHAGWAQLMPTEMAGWKSVGNATNYFKEYSVFMTGWAEDLGKLLPNI